MLADPDSRPAPAPGRGFEAALEGAAVSADEAAEAERVLLALANHATALEGGEK